MTAERQAGTAGYPRTAAEGLRGSVHARCQLVGWLRPLREEISASVTEPLAAESWSHKAREVLPAGRAGAVPRQRAQLCLQRQGNVPILPLSHLNF